ncbi:hypothetical protein HK105_206364 [Polyrhizophydium stewartii]|uniref:SET domain-containing protein n=1 Tax=Polyrhizophydium stewartii TaxID=2732419 RepID=A0ABR4N3I5_9FUNG|nr:hypothetical protein HK105_006275 [Polyrhizophydium stewartii]
MRGPNPNVAVKVIDDPAHPAHGQRGLFAARAIPPRTNIIDYIGAVCAPIAAPDAPSASAQGEQQSVSGHPVPGVLLSSVDLAAETSDYCLAFHSGLSIDAQHAGNEARFFNDYRGVGGSVKRPNVAFEIYRDARLVPRASSAALLGLGDALVGARDVPVHMQAMSMGVWSLNEKIPKGTELLINYGKGFWRARTSYAPDAAEETE